MDSLYVTWGTSTVKLTWREASILPDTSRITSAHGFCFRAGKLLLVNLHERGWDFPGGHLEREETPEECLKREAMEEAYVSGSSVLLGYMIVDHHDNPNWNEDTPYPKVGYQVFYQMEIEEEYPFQAEFESVDRCWIDPERIVDYYPAWNEVYQQILTQAYLVHINRQSEAAVDGCKD